MLYIVSGIVVTGAGGTALWALMPHNGKAAAITQKPLLDTLIPIAIVSGLAIGLALVIAGAASLV